MNAETSQVSHLAGRQIDSNCSGPFNAVGQDQSIAGCHAASRLHPAGLVDSWNLAHLVRHSLEVGINREIPKTYQNQPKNYGLAR